MEFKTAYGPKQTTRITFAELGRTQQNLRQETDINWIMKKYLKTGHLSHAQAYGGEYGFATSQDFHEAMNVVTAAHEMFDALPSQTRNRFANSPSAFLDFVQDPANTDELVRMGLAKAPPEPPAEPPKPPPAQPPEGGGGPLST